MSGQWRYIMYHEIVKFNKLKSKAVSNLVNIQEPKENDRSPVIVVDGNPASIEEVIKELDDLIATICTNDQPLIVTRPGTIRYLLSKDGQSIISGIEMQQKSCIQLAACTQGSVQSSKTTAKWKAFTDEGKIITLVMGDITECQVDVIVNAANSMLDHANGVAAAIVRKGGGIIQKESSCYIQNEGKLCDGDAIMMKEVGSLPCQRLIHAAFPTWNGGRFYERSELISACTKSLNLAVHYCSVAFPGNAHGFPAAVYAHSMIKAFVSWSKANHASTLCDIRVVVSDTTLLNAFSEGIKKNEHCRVLSGHVDIDDAASDSTNRLYDHQDEKQTNAIELDRCTLSSVKEPSLTSGPQLQLENQSSTDSPSGDIEFAKQYIELLYGNIVDYQVLIMCCSYIAI